ncbi:MAG: alpha/beta hydrolase [Gemmiger sp.]
MKKMIHVLCIVLCCIGALLAAAVVLLRYLVNRPAVAAGYFGHTNAVEKLEQRYTARGGYETAVYTLRGGEGADRCRVWYPKALEQSDALWPVVVMANGTGIPSSKYEAVFEHLASWGFLVVGNDDASSWSGSSTVSALEALLTADADSESLFYHRVDRANIGAAGHSQGGVGALNAAVSCDRFTSLYTASMTWPDLAAALEWPYDPSAVTVPWFFTAGTGKADAETISPLAAMDSLFDQCKSGKLTVMARRKDTDHGEMLAGADGYMTAWFCSTLKKDGDAAAVFTGEQPELAANPLWQDVHIRD